MYLPIYNQGVLIIDPPFAYQLNLLDSLDHFRKNNKLHPLDQTLVARN